MKQRHLNGAFVLALSLLFSTLVACSAGEKDNSADVARNQPVASILQNDLAGGKLTQTFDLGSTECFKFGTEYTTVYVATGWRITDSKTLRMKAYMTGMTPDCRSQVLIEHVHADISIKSTKEGIDGLKQDAMDDTFHGAAQPGFAINPPYYYEEVFAVEGFSQFLISGWSFYFSGYGGGGVDQKRLTEQNLVKDGGACASKFQVVYDILIRNPGEELYHTRSIVSEFYVPVSGIAICPTLKVAQEKQDAANK